MKEEDITVKHYKEVIDYVMDLETYSPSEFLVKIKQGLTELLEKHVKELESLNRRKEN